MKTTHQPLPRGTRAAGPNIPPNMRARLQAAEARAWSHSTLAGQLWESGIRASLAIRLASKNNSCKSKSPAHDHPVAKNGGTAPADPEKPLECEKMKTYTIQQKQSNSGSIHDLASATKNREIRVPSAATHILILAAYYGGKGYTTHNSPEAAAAKYKQLRRENYSVQAFSAKGEHLDFDGEDFRRGEPMLDLA